MKMAFNNSRVTMQDKKRRTNLILNSSIAIVLGLIVIVGSIIFFNDSNNTASTESEESQTLAEKHLSSQESNEDSGSLADKGQNDENENSGAAVEDDEKEDAADEKATEDKEAEELAAKEKKEKEKKEKEEQKRKEDEKKELESNDETNSDDWKPIGTSQTGEHVSSYDEGTVDWNEKVKALSYATGINADNMTVWYIGNDGSPQKSVGTVSESGKPNEKYRVYLEWVDQKGWKPVKMEKL
ncbi:DUF1510 family protein [Jeotgalibacillus sp. S-D1]|nr:DUF1510 family protein [Jeotgalibacillus sp. S-D1]